jgi:hypothetical protein
MTKTLEEWSATLRPVPTMVNGLEDIAKDFRLTLPDRRHLFLFNSIPMQGFREMGALDEMAKKQQEHRILQEEVLEQAREQGGNVPDLSHVTAEVTRQANMANALKQQMEGLAAAGRQEDEGRRVEALREMEKLAAARRAEEEKARISREVSQVHLDGMAADIDRIREASTAAGVTNNTVTHQYDQRVTHQYVENHNTHAMMMNFMAHHQQQLAAFAVQQGITNDRAMEVLAEHLKRQQAQPNQVVQILQQTLVNPNFGQQDPKPPPGYGAARTSAKQRESTYPFPFSAQMAPTPVPVAALQPATRETAAMVPETPVPVPRSRSRGGRKPKEDKEVVPVKTRASSRTPAKPTPALDTPMPSALKRASSETEHVPVTFEKPQKKTRPVSVGERVPVIRAKAKARSKTPIEEAETPQAPKRKSRARSVTETEVIPVAMNRSGRSRSRPPPRQASETPVLMDVARAAVALGEDSEVDVIPQVKKAPKAKAPPKKPVAKASRGKVVLDREAIKAQIRRVSVSVAPVKRGRGRPPGSLNKATLARLQPVV